MNTVNPFYATWYNPTRPRPLKFVSPLVGFLTIVLLVALPVGGNPNLSTGSKATYDLKSTISFAPIVCETLPASTGPSSMIVCPMIATVPSSIDITGTLGWSATAVSSTTAVLNVTRDLTISHDGLMVPSFHNTGSFNESVDLATRIIRIAPSFEPELDAALQSAQTSLATSLPTGIDPSLIGNSLIPVTIEPHPVYTMWWVNEILHQGQAVPVLVFNTTVTGSTSVNLGGLGTRDAWKLVYNLTDIFQPSSLTASITYPTWMSHDFEFVLTFNYDKTSGLLLSATADIHRGFELIEPRCSSTATSGTVCPLTGSIAAVGWCGFDVSATLTLASTSLSLDQTMPSSSSSSGGSPSGSGGTTGGSGGSSGGTGGSGNPGSNPGGSSGGNNGGNRGGSSGGNSGSGPGSGGTTSGSSSQPASPSSTSSLLYLILGLVVVAIVVASLLFVRRRSKGQPQTPSKP